MTEENKPTTTEEPNSVQQPSHQTSPAAPSAKGTSGLAIAGLVIGIIAALASFIPIINNGAFFIGIIGLILAIAGLMQVRKGTKQGKGIAIAGIVLCIVSLVITLMVQAACSAALDSIDTGSASTTSATSASASSAATDSSSTEEAAQADTAESKYSVTIDGATQGADYNGNPAVIVTYTWQNNSDSAQSFASALYAKCFQNGVQLDTAIVTDGIDNDGYLNEVKPGGTTTLQLAYELDDQSPVEVEVSELISLNDDILAQATFTL